MTTYGPPARVESDETTLQQASGQAARGSDKEETPMGPAEGGRPTHLAAPAASDHTHARDTSGDSDAADASEHADARLRRFLHAYWLRPENALWMTLRSLALDVVAFEPPSADISCGDGVFSFLHAGGVFDEAFDVFTAVRRVNPLHEPRADMYDAPAERYAPGIVQKPRWTIDLGTDLKPNLLHKAAALRFYGRLIGHDNETPLPLDDGSLRTVYCNSAYWVRGIDALLRELGRVTRSDGRIVLHVKIAAMREYTLERFGDRLGGRFLEIIGRGRAECWPSLATRQEWERRFARAGLTVESAAPLATRTHAHVWDVGLRPLAPLLVRMTEAIEPQTRLAIKREWVDLYASLCEPFCDPDFDLFGETSEPAEMQYVLRRA
jgi:SAM-dependent methyltransferase